MSACGTPNTGLTGREVFPVEYGPDCRYPSPAEVLSVLDARKPAGRPSALSIARDVHQSILDLDARLDRLEQAPTGDDYKVIATTDEAIVVKTGRAEFAVLDKALVTDVPDEGAKVQVEPYARRRFDGLRADTPEESTEFTADGQPYTVKRLILGSAPAKLPIAEPQCPELQELVHQLEQLPAPDGFRRITHLLVDAGARDFTVVDPSPGNIIATPPAIGFTVASMKFQGRVTVLYERGLDTYAVELHRDGELVERVDEVFFDSLGQVLERLIDDGSWRLIRVQRLSGRKPVQH